LKRSLAISKLLGTDYEAKARNNLAELYRLQGRYVEAEPLLQESLAIRERALGPDHAAVAASLRNLAELYRSQGRFKEAEPLFKRSVTVSEKALGPDHRFVALMIGSHGCIQTRPLPEIPSDVEESVPYATRH
jgi:tetratricopeptide (TPR) repeat protein